jgi:hypothetical protein
MLLGLRRHHRVADQHPVHRRPRRRALCTALRHLERDPPRPHRRCGRRSSHTSASVEAASRDGEVRGLREASRSPSTPAAACRAFHAYTDCRDTPVPDGYLADR